MRSVVHLARSVVHSQFYDINARNLYQYGAGADWDFSPILIEVEGCFVYISALAAPSLATALSKALPTRELQMKDSKYKQRKGC